MIVLYSYPDLFGVEDNNPYGLKIFAFLTLCGLPFEHRHILDTKLAPRGQLPYIDDDGAIIGDSDAIVAHLKAVRELCDVPLVASGGAGAPEHFVDVFNQAGVDAALAASVFHSGAIAIPDLKTTLAASGIEMRL